MSAMDLMNFMNFVFEWWLICLNNYVCSLVFQKETTEFIQSICCVVLIRYASWVSQGSQGILCP